MNRIPATGCTFPGSDDIGIEPSFAGSAAQLSAGVSLLLVTLLSLGLWAAIWAVAGSLGATGR